MTENSNSQESPERVSLSELAEFSNRYSDKYNHPDEWLYKYIRLLILMKKYIEHAGDCEGVDFLTYEIYSPNSILSTEDFKALKNIRDNVVLK